MLGTYFGLEESLQTSFQITMATSWATINHQQSVLALWYPRKFCSDFQCEGMFFLCLIWINCKYCIACLHYIGYVECVQMFVYSSVMRGCVYFLVVANICSSRWLQPLRSPNEEWPRNLHLRFLLLNLSIVQCLAMQELISSTQRVLFLHFHNANPELFSGKLLFVANLLPLLFAVSSPSSVCIFFCT